MFNRLAKAVAATGALVSVTWSHPASSSGSAPHLPEPVARPIPSTDTNTYIRRAVRVQLAAREKIWNANIYAAAVALFHNLQSKEFLEQYAFAEKNNRAVIADFISAWNSIPGQGVQEDEDTLDALENLFSAMMTGIRNARALVNQKEPFLQLLEWDMVSLSPSQSRFNFELKNLDGVNNPASQTIQIDALASELAGLYEEWINHYQSRKKTPSMFLKKANGILNRYFAELLKINADETPVAASHWATPEVQAALNYYFDQRELLFRIYSTTAVAPLKTDEIDQKILAMRRYVTYIKSMLARTDEYTRKITLGPIVINFGVDRTTKINAALEKYHSICALPFDPPKQGDPQIHSRIVAALHNGRLGRLG